MSRLSHYFDPFRSRGNRRDLRTFVRGRQWSMEMAHPKAFCAFSDFPYADFREHDVNSGALQCRFRGALAAPLATLLRRGV